MQDSDDKNSGDHEAFIILPNVMSYDNSILHTNIHPCARHLITKIAIIKRVSSEKSLRQVKTNPALLITIDIIISLDAIIMSYSQMHICIPQIIIISTSLTLLTSDRLVLVLSPPVSAHGLRDNSSRVIPNENGVCGLVKSSSYRMCMLLIFTNRFCVK